MSTEPITKEFIKSLSADQLKAEMRNPERLAEINAFLSTPEAASLADEVVAEIPVVDPPVLTPEEQAADAAAAEQARVAAQAEADRVVAEKAAAEAAVVATEAAKPKKIVVEYQATDENGQPIGRPTHLEAYSWEEMSQKQQEAHVQATRAFHRLKNQKTTFNKKLETPILIPEVPLMSEQERIQAALDLNNEDEVVVTKADRKLRADQILRDQRQEAIHKEEVRQRDASEEFKAKHIDDFNPCQANAAIITAYIKENNLAWTVDNLELAFAATEPQLAPKEAPIAAVPAPEPSANPVVAVPKEPVAPAAPAAAIQPTPVTPTLEVPAVPAPAANPQVPAARPGVNAGLIPGQQTGVRPVVKPQGLTKKDIKSWTPEQMRKEMKNPARLAEINRVLAGR